MLRRTLTRTFAHARTYNFFCTSQNGPKAPTNNGASAPPNAQSAFYNKLKEQADKQNSAQPQDEAAGVGNAETDAPRRPPLKRQALNNPNHDAYEFSNHMIYNSTFDFEQFRVRLRSFIVASGLMTSTALFSFYMGHPYIAILPVFLALKTFTQYTKGSSYCKRLVKTLTLSPDLRDVTIEVAKGNSIVAQIEKISLKSINDIRPVVESDQKESSFVIVFDCEGTDLSKHENMRVIVRGDKMYVDNFKLLKQVLSGEAQEVLRYKKVESAKNKDDKELEKKLEEEILAASDADKKK